MDKEVFFSYANQRGNFQVLDMSPCWKFKVTVFAFYQVTISWTNTCDFTSSIKTMAGSMLLLNNVPLQSSQTSNHSFGIYRQHLHSASCSESHFPQAIGKKIHLKKTPFAGLPVCSYSAKPVPLVNSEDAPFVSKVYLSSMPKNNFMHFYF